MRFLLGLAEAGLFPGMILYLTYWYPAHRRGRMTYLLHDGARACGRDRRPGVRHILKASTAPGLHGWQWLFLPEGVPTVLVGVLVLLKLDNRINGARWLTDEEKALLARNVRAEDAGSTRRSARCSLSPRVWLMGAIYFSFVMGLYGVGFWLPTIIKSTGVTDALTIGLLSAIPYAAAVVAMILICAAPTGAANGAGTSRCRPRSARSGSCSGPVGAPDGARDARAHARDDGHPDHAAAVLESAHRVPRRRGRRRGDRAHQLGRQSRRLPEPLPDRLAEAGHRVDRGGDVHARRALQLVLGGLLALSVPKSLVNR